MSFIANAQVDSVTAPAIFGPQKNYMFGIKDVQFGYMGEHTDSFLLNQQLWYLAGNPGAGKVLTSNSVGLATWENPATATYSAGNGAYLSNDSFGVGRSKFIENLVWQYGNKFFAISDSEDVNNSTYLFFVGDPGTGNMRFIVNPYRMQVEASNRISLISQGNFVLQSNGGDLNIDVTGNIVERATNTIGSSVFNTTGLFINGIYSQNYRSNIFTQHIYYLSPGNYGIGVDVNRFDCDTGGVLHWASWTGAGDTIGEVMFGGGADGRQYKAATLFANVPQATGMDDYVVPTAGQVFRVNDTGMGFWFSGTKKAEIDTNGIGILSGIKIASGAGSGKALVSDGAGAGTWGPVIASGTYTPTLTNTANITASTPYVTTYMRVGNTVTMAGTLDIDPDVTTTTTTLGISLPIASNFTGSQDGGGTAGSQTIAAMVAGISTDATNDRLTLQFVSNDTNNSTLQFTATYQIK